MVVLLGVWNVCEFSGGDRESLQMLVVPSDTVGECLAVDDVDRGTMSEWIGGID